MEALVQNRCAVYAGAHLYHHICDQHDRGLGEGDGEAAEPDISKDSDTKDGIFRSLQGWRVNWFVDI